MSYTNSLSKLCRELLQQIGDLSPMRKGSVIKRDIPYKRKDGSKGSRGPYYTYTFKKNNKTVGRHLKDEQEAEMYRQQIESFHSFKDISNRFVETSQALADNEVEKRRGKKNSSAKSKKNLNGKSGR